MVAINSHLAGRVLGLAHRVGAETEGLAHSVGAETEGLAHRVGADEGLAHRVGAETEGQAHRMGQKTDGGPFDSEFWEETDVVVTALVSADVCFLHYALLLPSLITLLLLPYYSHSHCYYLQLILLLYIINLITACRTMCRRGSMWTSSAYGTASGCWTPVHWAPKAILRYLHPNPYSIQFG